MIAENTPNTDAILAQAACALQPTPGGVSGSSSSDAAGAKFGAPVVQTIGKIRSSGAVSPRSASPRSVVASLSHGVHPVPKAPPAHLVLARARLAAETAETATFGTNAGSSQASVFTPDRVIRDSTMEERIGYSNPADAIDVTPVRVMGIATPVEDVVMSAVLSSPSLVLGASSAATQQRLPD